MFQDVVWRLIGHVQLKVLVVPGNGVFWRTDPSSRKHFVFVDIPWFPAFHVAAVAGLFCFCSSNAGFARAQPSLRNKWEFFWTLVGFRPPLYSARKHYQIKVGKMAFLFFGNRWRPWSILTWNRKFSSSISIHFWFIEIEICGRV